MSCIIFISIFAHIINNNQYTFTLVSRIYYIFVFLLLVCMSCEWRLKSSDKDVPGDNVVVDRYDRIESLYLTTGDFSALQQMNTNYPMQTRTLIEDVLKIGYVNDHDINNKFLNFYQDTTLQGLINEVEQQYAYMDDINKDLTNAFRKLRKKLPGMKIPMVYAQIGALDQSIIVGNNTLGISLDKYLGADYPLYKKYYPESQRKQMKRSMIVPDCLTFYILSCYPMPHAYDIGQLECDMHIGKIMWIVNSISHKPVFNTKYVAMVDRYMQKNKNIDMFTLLKATDYKDIVNH